jgi:hypothetical protein
MNNSQSETRVPIVHTLFNHTYNNVRQWQNKLRKILVNTSKYCDTILFADTQAKIEDEFQQAFIYIYKHNLI